LLPPLLYVLLGMPLAFVLDTLLSHIGLGSSRIVFSVVVLLVVAASLMNLGFFMAITMAAIHRHLGIDLAIDSETEWPSRTYGNTVRLFVSIAYVWGLVCVLIYGLLNWNIFWTGLASWNVFRTGFSVGIPIVSRAYLSSDLSRRIKETQELDLSQE